MLTYKAENLDMKIGELADKAGVNTQPVPLDVRLP